MDKIVKAHRIIVDPHLPGLDCQALAISNDLVLATGTHEEIASAYDFQLEDHGQATLVPMAINSHCHLELSYLKDKIAPGLGFPAWVRSMIKSSIKAFPEKQANKAVKSIADKTCVLADTATRYPKEAARAIMDSGLFFVLFPECINKTDMSALHNPTKYMDYGMYAGCGHALYSTDAEVLQKAKQYASAVKMPFSMHLAEHDHEIEAMSHGTGEFANMLHKAGMLRIYGPDKTPVQIADDLGLVDENTLLVHCVKLTDSDMALVAEKKASICLCPRSNEFIGVGRARWKELLGSGINLCLGTDSLASNTDIDVWNEVFFLAEHLDKDISLHNLIAMVTTNPARVLGLEGKFGRLVPGYAAKYCPMPNDIEKLRIKAHRA